MIASSDKNFTSLKGHFEGGQTHRFVDVHCHCLPSIDDGPATMEDALALCRALVADGIKTVVATAHQLGNFENKVSAEKIRTTVALLQGSLSQNEILLQVIPGSDCHVDERIVDMLASDAVVTLADKKKFVMIELPHKVFIDIEPLIRDLADRNIGVIISHPERNRALCGHLDILRKWLKYPVYTQLTAASLVGDFGIDACRAAWWFIEKGWASLVATDAHDLSSRPPRLRAACEIISLRCGSAAAWLLCVENPSRMVQSQRPLPVLISSNNCQPETVL